MSDGISILGVGASVSQSVATTAPREMLLDGPGMLRDLLALVQASDARGLVLHINNLENLSDVDTERAGTILRDLRDSMLMHSGLHVIAVGTHDAVQSVVATHTQVRSTFHIMSLEAIPVADVPRLLAQRYAHRRRMPKVTVTHPVEKRAVTALHKLFRGDLRDYSRPSKTASHPTLACRPCRYGQRRGAVWRPAADRRRNTPDAAAAVCGRFGLAAEGKPRGAGGRVGQT